MKQVLARGVTHREFLKICGLAIVGAGAGQMVVPPSPVSAETFTTLTVTGATYLATSSGGVGVGTASPQGKLNVVDSGPDPLFVDSSSALNTGLHIRNTSAGGHDWGLFSLGSSHPWGAGGFVIYDQTVARAGLFFSGGGYVGIGTTSPQSPVHIQGDALPQLLVRGANADVGVAIDNVGAGGREFRIFSEGSGGAWGAGNLVFFDQASQSPVVALNGASGNVGIGTTNPGARLDVAGEIKVNGVTAIRSDGIAAQSYYA